MCYTLDTAELNLGPLFKSTQPNTFAPNPARPTEVTQPNAPLALGILKRKLASVH